MDIAKINTIDRAAQNHDIKIEKLNESHDIRQIDQYEQNEEPKKDKQVLAQEEEVVLNTIKFGYNRTTNDFIVKVIMPDGTIGQYPTEDMIKLKEMLKDSMPNLTSGS